MCWIQLYDCMKMTDLLLIISVLIFKTFLGGMPPDPPRKGMRICASPIMSDHQDKMSDQFLVWTDSVRPLQNNYNCPCKHIPLVQTSFRTWYFCPCAINMSRFTTYYISVVNLQTVNKPVIDRLLPLWLLHTLMYTLG